MFTDSHCHLDFPELREQLPDVLAAMQAAQVDRAICISTRLETFDTVHALATGHAQLWATVGVHPDEADAQEPTLDDLLRRAALVQHQFGEQGAQRGEVEVAEVEGRVVEEYGAQGRHGATILLRLGRPATAGAVRQPSGKRAGRAAGPRCDALDGGAPRGEPAAAPIVP